MDCTFWARSLRSESKTFDKVKTSKKPVHISIEREVIVIPEAKKGKEEGCTHARAARGSPDLEDQGCGCGTGSAETRHQRRHR